MIPLRDHLIQAYGGPADRRDQDHPIKIDDESAGDVSRLFCQMHVQVDDTSFVLTMRDAPLGSAAKGLIEQQGGELTPGPRGSSVALQLDLTSITFIRKLATTIRNTVGRGKHYADPNWKWSCGRTAASLDRLADELKRFRFQRRSIGEVVGRPSRPKALRS